ncbi:hypothetical protein ACEPAF_9919 [Sanghuangporus sanghuang]|uniref:DUF833-domain-containing protein n=1 Tax=Sanghuangporus baumii TaxID=108892 RepID=A0A9Q5HPZ8_SANBA|nr:hypothetical protein A7U60_g9067 [Sanghuangporus baumii]
MCIGFWSLDHPDYALILCSNRDEYLSRPTSNAHFHCFGPESDLNGNFVLSGRDLKAGGSWFGINRAGRIALLTNISEAEGALYKESRGHLVSSFLLPEAPDASHFVGLLEREGSTDYAGFNLLLLTPTSGGESAADSLAYEASLITNSGGHGAIVKRDLLPEERRAGAISNGVDSGDGRTWPKVKKGVASLKELLHVNKANEQKLSEDELVEHLFGILSWQSDPPPSNRFQLRNSIEIPPLHMSGGLSPDAEPDDRDNIYGTRVSTVLLVRRDGQALFIERDFWKLDSEGNVVRGDPRQARVFRFQIDNLRKD